MPRPYKKGLRSTVYSRNKIETAREMIRVEELLKLLCDNALGKVELSSDRLRSVEILLRKALPDLSSVEQTVTNVQPFAVLPNEIKDIAAWEQAANPKNTEETQH